MYISKSIITALLLAGGASARSTQDNLKNQKRSAEEEVDPDCAAKENGAELFPEYDPANIAMKVESVIDTETCTYDVTVSYIPDTSIPFLDSPRGGVGRPPMLDVPPKYIELCDAEGHLEQFTGTDRNPLDPVNHGGTMDLYRTYVFTINTGDRVAEATGVQDVVVGFNPCGRRSNRYPQSDIHWYHNSAEERENMRCVTEGGYFCKPVEEQCSERGRKFNMGGPDSYEDIYCDPANPVFGSNAKNLPLGYLWTQDRPELGIANSGIPTQGLHAINAPEFFGRTESITKDVFVAYDGELVANNIAISAGFSKGYSYKNKYVKEYDWDSGLCVDPNARKLATKITTEYDPETGRTIASAHGPLKDCSGDSFTAVVDHTGAAESSKSAKSASKNAKASKAAKSSPVAVPQDPPASTCGHQRVTFVEAPGFINNKFFREGGPRTNQNGAPLFDSLDFNVYQDTFFMFDDISEENHGFFRVAGGMRVARLKESAGQHRGVDFNIRDQEGVGPASIGGFSPNLAMADIMIDHPDHGTGTIKVNGYHTTFGEGELAIIGGTGDFAGASGTVRPYYGLIYMDDDTIADNGLVLNPALTLTTSVVDGTPLSFGFYLDIDFTCNGY